MLLVGLQNCIAALENKMYDLIYTKSLQMQTALVAEGRAVCVGSYTTVYNCQSSSNFTLKKEKFYRMSIITQ